MTERFSPPRGPTGAAGPPPAWLADSDLPIEEIASSAFLHRVHLAAFEPVFFGPGSGQPPRNRFDSASGRFGVFYVGLGLAGALVETLLRSPGRRVISEAAIDARALSLLSCDRDLRMVRLHGNGLQQIGTDNAISIGPYEPCGLWADALWDHRSRPDGIVYLSRHNPGERCLAVFERPGITFTQVGGRPLRDLRQTLAPMLRDHGKSVERRESFAQP